VSRPGVRRKAFAGAAGCLALLAGGAMLALAVAASASPRVLADTTTEPVATEPVPDPAPAPKPKPKPKPTPKPAQSTSPKRTYSAPTRTRSTPTSTPAQARSSATTRPTKPRVTLKHKPRKPKKAVITTSAPVETTPVETTPVPAFFVPVPVGARRAPAQVGGNPQITSILFVAGVTFAALLFLLAATVPGTPVRFTPVGRVVIEHQQDFVLVGVAAFVITVFVYFLTGNGL
jgi:hypothetical protein